MTTHEELSRFDLHVLLLTRDRSRKRYSFHYDEMSAPSFPICRRALCRVVREFLHHYHWKQVRHRMLQSHSRHLAHTFTATAKAIRHVGAVRVSSRYRAFILHYRWQASRKGSDREDCRCIGSNPSRAVGGSLPVT